MTDVFTRPASRASPSDVTGLAGDQPGAVPILDTDPTLSDLPVDENGDAVPLLFVSDGSTGVTGEGGDLVLAAPNGSSGVDVTVAADLSSSVTLGVDSTGLL